MKLCVLLLATLVAKTLSQSGDETNSCTVKPAQESCAACIATAKECAWCAMENYDGKKQFRCDLREHHSRNRCDNIIFPEDAKREIDTKNVTDGDSPKDAVQIQPQRVRVRVRPNKPKRITVKFRQAANYPVDLYYLMDLSNSMEDDKENLAVLGNLIADRMTSITKNFRLGFGSFVDKVVSPYVSTVPAKLKEPCVTFSKQKCVAPYGFKNQLRLDHETSKFAEEVKAANVSGNLDAPEGGFDAIMQAVVCENEIGWRPISRRILVVSTDAGFHYAGDGKLGGIVIPNDGQCHMANDIYTKSTTQDYPSVSQISNTIKAKDVSVIFAVTADQFEVYEKLSQYIDSSATGVLANDSSNIVKLIQDNYKKITSVVKLRAENVGENITVNFYSRCFGGEEEKRDNCSDLKIGDTVTFDVELTVSGCPKDKKLWKRNVIIKPVGYKEKLLLELDLICQCDCEKRENRDEASDKCSNGNGTFACGKCKCNPGRYGKNCECKADDANSNEIFQQCIMPNTTIPCSGRGSCECGKCDCDPRSSESAQIFSGDFCECDDFSCDRYNNLLCGGPSRGKCECGVCSCNSGYNGSVCECEQSDRNCRTDDGGICSGHGTCECGRCACEKMYTGLKCEQCPTCPDKCEEFKPCVSCRVMKSGKYSSEECDLNCPSDVIEEQEIDKERPNVPICYLKNDESCIVYFTYEYDKKGDTVLRVQKKELCPESVNLLAILGGVIGGIVAVGLLLLLIWKFLTFIHDSREFAKFEKERQNAKWDTGENPIYKQATSTFKNPMYSGQ